VTTNFITTDGGEELAIMPRAVYEALIDAADEIQDLADVRARRGEPTLPLEVGMAIIKGEMSPVEAWRKELGLTQAQLAQKAGVRPATISDIESAKSHGRFDVMQRIAAALGLDLDDLAQPR
jgi:DNA-binding XRE family transcriptional regulator